ncbi:MAG: hypothetical protein LBU65_01110 [Planctomycetaceae bacterium]|jgi:serine/threonine protein kinase|nr:hypothetical protein [Planctomycetaceae bacterium]
MANIQQALESYIILLDTCFAMQPGNAFKFFLAQNENVLKRNSINVAMKVIQELHGLRNAKPETCDEPDVPEKAQKAHNRIAKAQKKGLITLRQDPIDNKSNNDAVMVRVVQQVLFSKPVLLLTHDRNLADTVKNYKKIASNTRDLIIAGLASDGSIFDWDDRNNKTTANRATTKSRKVTGTMPQTRTQSVRYTQQSANAFAKSATLFGGYDTRISVRETLREGCSLSTKSGCRITLRKQIASGGEGTVYELDDNKTVCKIYHNDKLTKGLQDKIELMLTRNLSDGQICYPLEAVYDSIGTFRGFVMPKAAGKPLGHHLFHPSFAKMNPQWNRKHSTQLAITILRKIQYLHSLNILIGDINPMNILVVNENTVYFVDCDSYQVEGYPCPVGTPVFAAPEIQGKDFKTFLRTQDHDLFAVATLLFMIFMPGKAPYGHEGGEGVSENIKQGHFPYALGERHTQNAPKGKWKFCWSHLANLKGAFNRSFHSDAKDEGRVPVTQWLNSLQKYLQVLETSGYVGPQKVAGVDINLFPENICRQEKGGVITPPVGITNETDFQRDMNKLVAELSGNYVHPNRSQPRTNNTSKTNKTSHIPPQPSPPANQPAHTPPPPPSGGIFDWLKKLFQ